MSQSEKRVEFYSNGYRLVGVLHVPDGEDGRARPGVVVCGGFGAVKELRTPGVCEWLADAGFISMRFDYQGFGEAEGPKWRLIPLEQVQNIRDALTALTEQPEVDATRIGVFGNSWGGAPAVVATAADPRARCVVTCGSPMNGQRWMRSLRRHYEWLDFRKRVEADRRRRVQTGESQYVPSDEVMIPDPRTDKEHVESDQLLKWRFELPLETAEAIIDFRPEDHLSRISPRGAMFIHTGFDSLVPVEESIAGFERALEPRRIHIEPGAQHHDVYYSPWRERVLTVATEWFREQMA
ncbi:MAG: alpha/beta hydrolase [Candidatus Dormibacteraceae bacterium]